MDLSRSCCEHASDKVNGPGSAVPCQFGNDISIVSEFEITNFHGMNVLRPDEFPLPLNVEASMPKPPSQLECEGIFAECDRLQQHGHSPWKRSHVENARVSSMALVCTSRETMHPLQVGIF